MSKFIQLSFPQGDDKTYTITIKDANGVGIDIAGSTIESQIRVGYDKDVIATFTGVLVDPNNGVMSITMDSATSAALPVKGAMSKFVFDVELTYNTGEKTKVIYGNLIITREVTR